MLKGLGHEKIEGRYFLILQTCRKAMVNWSMTGRIVMLLVMNYSKQYWATAKVVMQENVKFNLSSHKDGLYSRPGLFKQNDIVVFTWCKKTWKKLISLRITKHKRLQDITEKKGIVYIQRMFTGRTGSSPWHVRIETAVSAYKRYAL